MAGSFNTMLRGTAFALGLLFARSAGAQVPLDDDLVTPRIMALGGKAEATGSSTSSLFGNPAMLAAIKGYHIDANVAFDPTVNRWHLGTAVADSSRQFVAAGTSYNFTIIDTPTYQRQVHDVRLSAAVPLGDVVGLGLSLRYLNANNGPRLANTMLPVTGWAGFTFDAGVYVRPIKMLVISASGHNLTNPETANAPIGMGLGASLNPLEWLTVVADVQLDFRLYGQVKGRYSGGLELFLGGHYAIRAGYAYDDLRGGLHMVTAGFGYIDEKFSIELGYRQGVSPTVQSTLMLTGRIFIPSS